jgi:hypothetical protein
VTAGSRAYGREVGVVQRLFAFRGTLTLVKHVLIVGVRGLALLTHWPRVAAYLAPIWSLGYGLLALSWALGASGYPFSEAVDPDAGLSLLGGVAPGIGAAGLATTSLLGAVVGAAMLRDGGRGAGRLFALGFGAFTAVTFAVLLPDLRVLVVMAYTPILLVGAPFGWPPGVSLASELTWPLVHQLVAMAGGIAWVGATIRYRRRTAGACERCGRARTELGEQGVARAALWGRRAVAVAVVIPLVYVATRWAWAIGIPLGLPVDALRAGNDMTWLGGAILASVAALGALLTAGLVRSWGEVVPAWVPALGRRRIPPGLAIVPASLMTIVITSAGLAFVRTVLVGEMPFRMDEWAVVGPTLLWPVWGAALGVATLAYFYRRRGRCKTCGRGGSWREAQPCTTPDLDCAKARGKAQRCRTGSSRAPGRCSGGGCLRVGARTRRTRPSTRGWRARLPVSGRPRPCPRSRDR